MKNSIYKPDWILVTVVITQLILGIAFIYSISGSYSEQITGNYYSFFQSYLWDLLFSFIVAWLIFYYYSAALIKKYSTWVLAATLLLLCVALMPGVTSMQATKLGFTFGSIFIYLLPLVTLLVIVSISRYISDYYNNNTFRSTHALVLSLLFLLICVLLMNQPNSKGIVILGIVFITLCFSAKLYKISSLLILILLLLFIGVELLEPYRYLRLISFLDPFNDSLGSGYVLSMSLSAIGGSNLLGVGYGEGIINQHLPDAFDGFIFSSIIEETGFVGAFIVISCSMIIQWRSFVIAQRLIIGKRIYEGIVVMGISSWLSILSILHISVCLGIFPTHYMPYPLISFDQAYLMMTLVGIAIILRTGMTVAPCKGSVNIRQQPVATILFVLFIVIILRTFYSSVLDYELSQQHLENIDIYKKIIEKQSLKKNA